MMVAKKLKLYDSHKIFSLYMQMLDNLHLYLLDKELIEDADQIESMDIDWENSQRFIRVCFKPSGDYELNKPVVVLDADEFDTYVENGFRL